MTGTLDRCQKVLRCSDIILASFFGQGGWESFRKCPNYGQAVWPGMGSQKTMHVGLEGVLEELIFEIL